MKKAVMMYSLGKDSTTAFIKAEECGYKIDRIINMFDIEREVSQVHMAKRSLVEFLADKMGVDVDFIGKAKGGDFNKQWQDMYDHYASLGYEVMVHGDLFLEDVRKFKDDHAKGKSIENVYPLWGMNSEECAKYILDCGVDSYITVTNKDVLKPFIGKKYSEMLPHIPEGIDVCGENGEFHTIVCKAPFLDKELEFTFDPVKQLTNEFKEKTFKYWYTIVTDFK